jgi:hypothetical protein
MPDDTNHIVLEGVIETPVVRTNDVGALSARAYLTCGGAQPFSVLIWAIGCEAAQIADLPPGSRIRVTGSLSWDTVARRLTVSADELQVIRRLTGDMAERTSIRGGIDDLLPLRARTEP